MNYENKLSTFTREQWFTNVGTFTLWCA